MAIYQKKDFLNLRFNPLEENPIREVYPDLNDIIRPEILSEPLLDAMIRYVIMLCEPKSIVFLSESDLNKRKDLAAELAGLPMDVNILDKIFSYDNELVLELTIRYLTRFSKNKEFAALIAMEQVYWEEIKLLLKPIDESEKDNNVLAAIQKKSAIKNEIDSDLKRIGDYYASFLGEDKDLIAKKERVRPESIRRLQKK